MPTVGSLRDDTSEGQSKLERLAARIPGYKGYMDRRTGSESDKIVRSKILHSLGVATRSASMALSRAIEIPAPDKSEVIGKLIFRLNYIYSSLSAHPIGQAGLLEATKIGEDEADRLVSQDFAMVDMAEEIETKGKELLELAIRGDYDSIAKVIEELQAIMSRIEGAASSREEVLDGMRGRARQWTATEK